jgi:dipeptidyl aminopeptidase/acylaminoacyl peptidase
MYRVVPIVLLACSLLVACAGRGDDATAPPLQPPADRSPRPVGSLAEVFVDSSRPTAEHGSAPAAPQRTLRTTILFPATSEDGGLDSGGRPYPLIVFGHGSGGFGARYLPLLRSWAAQGYVVAAPVFPFAADGDAGGEASTEDLANQPADMAFVVTELLRLSGDAASPIGGAIDPDRIGAAGHSLGAMTTLALAANTCCHDPRVKAAAILAGREMPFGNGRFFYRIRTPLLFVHGDADANVPYRDGRRAYDNAPPPRFFVTLLGGDHSSPYAPFGSPTTQVTVDATLHFFDAYLKGDTGEVARLLTDSSRAGVARVESET